MKATPSKRPDVAYLRVSTDKQGIRGLGMDAQKTAVRKFLGREPDHEFTEVETGRKKDRPELDKALTCCRKTKGQLIIAKLDRLARNAAFLLSLRDSGVDFVCCDMPHADRFTIGVLALVAEREADLISERTKAALAAAKQRGTKLGNPKLAKVRPLAVSARQKKAREFALKLKPVIDKARKHGITSYREIAEALNQRGYRSAQGKQFYAQSVKNLLALLGA
jgi:DNA invertase Pin-like site-specific DNA recombinase